MKRSRTLAISMVAGLLLAGGGAAAAHADASQIYRLGGIDRVVVSYKSTGNELRVRDDYSDGYGGRSYWRTSNGATGTADNSNGAYTSVPFTIPGSTGTMYFKACAKNGGVDVGCNSSDVSTTL